MAGYSLGWTRPNQGETQDREDGEGEDADEEELRRRVIQSFRSPQSTRSAYARHLYLGGRYERRSRSPSRSRSRSPIRSLSEVRRREESLERRRRELSAERRYHVELNGIRRRDRSVERSRHSPDRRRSLERRRSTERRRSPDRRRSPERSRREDSLDRRRRGERSAGTSSEKPPAKVVIEEVVSSRLAELMTRGVPTARSKTIQDCYKLEFLDPSFSMNPPMVDDWQTDRVKKHASRKTIEAEEKQWLAMQFKIMDIQ